MLKSEKNGYRGLEFSVRRLDEGRWEWAVYPKKEEGARFSGSVGGNQEKAIAACKVAIDRWLSAKSN